MKRITLAIACAAISALTAADNTATVIGAGYALPNIVKVAPGQVITFFLHGIGAGLTKPVVASSLPLPTLLARISAAFTRQGPAIPVPIIGVEPVSPVCGIVQPGCGYTYTAVTVQIPFNTYGQDPTAFVGSLPLSGKTLAPSRYTHRESIWPQSRPTTRMASFVQNPGGWLCSCKNSQSAARASGKVPQFCVTLVPSVLPPTTHSDTSEYPGFCVSLAEGPRQLQRNKRRRRCAYTPLPSEILRHPTAKLHSHLHPRAIQSR
jgi:hypothetical protein